MRLTVLAFCALFLFSCSQGDDARAREQADRTREQARQTAEQLKRDSRVALHQAEVDAAKASKEINRGLDKTRDKVRQALDAPPDNGQRTNQDDH